MFNHGVTCLEKPKVTWKLERKGGGVTPKGAAGPRSGAENPPPFTNSHFFTNKASTNANMLQWPGEILFASFLGIIILISIILIQQPDPPRYQDQPRRTPSPSPPPSPILNTINTPYNETEIASLLTELYELLVKLAYIPHEAVTWPPESGHEINEELCTQLGMDAAVISLMKRIPYVNSDEGYGLHLFPRSEADSFLRDDDILESRDPENFSTELRLYYILPHDIALSHNMCDGMTLVLDTKASTLYLHSVS